MYITMKKIYSKPNTALLHLNIRSQILAGSSVINTTSMKQDISEAGVLDAEDKGGDNLGKGNNLWDAWDE